MKRRLYKVVDTFTDQVVFEGTYEEIADRFNAPVQTLMADVKGHRRFKKRYLVEFTGTLKDMSNYVQYKPKKEKIRKEDHLKALLMKYGNAYVSYNPVPFFPDLLDAGLNCRVRKPKCWKARENEYIVEVVYGL